MGNHNSSYQYDIETDGQIANLHELDGRIPQGDYFVLRMGISPRVGPTNSVTRWFHRDLFLAEGRDRIRFLCSFARLPRYLCNSDRLAQQVIDYASEAARHHDFAASRLLPINVRITLTINNDDLFDEADPSVEHAVRESLQEVRTVPATKSAVEALEEVETLECEDNCVICLEELSPFSSTRSDSGGDNDDDDDRKVMKLPCSHVFHKYCIVQWFQANHLCPVCRYAMPT